MIKKAINFFISNLLYMSIVNLLIIIVIILILYWIFSSGVTKSDNTKNEKKYKNKQKRESSQGDEPPARCGPKAVTRDVQLDFYPNNQYHPDYTDILSIIQNWTKTDKFNSANLPVREVQGTEVRTVWPLAEKLVYSIEKRAGVGLHLIEVGNIHQYETEVQVRYVFDMVLQRDAPEPSNTKIIINIVALQDEEANEDDFFVPDNMVFTIDNKQILFWDTGMKSVIIEDLYIVGYISPGNKKYAEIGGLEKIADNKYHKFDRIEENGDEITDPEYVRQEVIKHKKLQNEEQRYCNVLLDEDCRDFFDQDFYEAPVGPNTPDIDDIPDRVCTKMGTELYDKYWGPPPGMFFD